MFLTEFGNLIGGITVSVLASNVIDVS